MIFFFRWFRSAVTARVNSFESTPSFPWVFSSIFAPEEIFPCFTLSIRVILFIWNLSKMKVFFVFTPSCLDHFIGNTSCLQANNLLTLFFLSHFVMKKESK